MNKLKKEVGLIELRKEPWQPLGLLFFKFNPFRFEQLHRLTLVLIGVLFSCNPIKTEKQDTVHPKPNIVYILADDLGWMDTGVYGSTFYETPNIDKLAKMGMLFTNAYAGAANCAPSRACLMTGQHTPRHGIYTVANSDRGDSRTRKLVPTTNKTELADSVITLAKMLKSEGYATGTFGKWHLSEDPLKYGFDSNVAGDHRGHPGNAGYFAPYNVKGLKDAKEGENLTDRLTQEALHFMREQKEAPFFAYLSYYAVHTPLATTEALKAKYEIKGGNPNQNNATYAGMIETVDKNVGKLIEFLEDENLLEKTLIVFTSDNGGIRDISQQDPLRAGKGSYYEGGIRVPFIFSWKGQIQPDSKSGTLTTNLDVFPTLMEFSGASLSNQPLDGNSLVAVLHGKSMPERDVFFHFPIYLEAYSRQTDDGRDPLFRTRPGTVVISGKWKLHQYFEDGGLELYDLENDVGERNNLAETQKEIAEKLMQKMTVWRKNLNAPIPTEFNPDYDADYTLTSTRTSN